MDKRNKSESLNIKLDDKLNKKSVYKNKDI